MSHRFSVSFPCDLLFQLRCLIQSLTFLSQNLLLYFHFLPMFHWFLLETHQNVDCFGDYSPQSAGSFFVFMSKSSVISSSLISSTLLSMSSSFLLIQQHCHCCIGHFPSHLSILFYFLSFHSLKYLFSCPIYHKCCLTHLLAYFHTSFMSQLHYLFVQRVRFFDDVGITFNYGNRWTVWIVYGSYVIKWLYLSYIIFLLHQLFHNVDIFNNVKITFIVVCLH